MKYKMATLILLSLTSASAFAVDSSYRYVSFKDCYCNLPLFATLEGGYTWTSLGDSVFNGNRVGTSKNGLTGRIGAGAIHWINPILGFSGEVGWGFYDYTKFASSVSGNANNKIYGFDALVGGIYKYCQFDFALKVGAMVQDVRMYRNSNLSALIAGSTVTGSSTSTSTVSSVVPVVKVAAAYNLNSNWAVSLAYQHAFGNNNVSQTSTKTFTPTSITSITSRIDAPFNLDSVLLGLRYSFG